jgi:hypothetical protein
MTDELPEIFDRLKPQPAPPELRPRVLAAVERELTRRKKPRWERAFELGVAASLLVGVGLNVWQWRGDGHRQASVHGPLPAAAREELVDAVASITDEATAKMLVDGLVSMRLHPDRAVTGDANDSLKN